MNEVFHLFETLYLTYCEALAYWVARVPLGQKTTMTDPQGAVIPIMPYKVPRDLTKLLVSAHALLGERLTLTTTI